MKDKIKIQLCPICETGRNDYLLDKKSAFCSYIGHLKNGECSQFIPINKNEKNA